MTSVMKVSFKSKIKPGQWFSMNPAIRGSEINGNMNFQAITKSNKLSEDSISLASSANTPRAIESYANNLLRCIHSLLASERDKGFI